MNSSGTSIKVTSPTAQSTGVINVTVATAKGGSSATTSSDQFTYNPSPTAPKLAVSLTPDATGVVSGANVGFTITTNNNGQSSADSAALTDTLPTATGINWAVASGPSDCAIRSGVLTCGPSSLAGGGSYAVHITSPTTLTTCGTTYVTLSDTASLAATNVGSPATSQSQLNVVCLGDASGTIVDSTGTGVSNSSVSLCPTNPLLPLQSCATTITNTSGYYSIGNLPSGTYNGTVTTLIGLLQFNNIVIVGGQITSIPIQTLAGVLVPMPATVSLQSGTLPIQTSASTAGTLPNILSTAQTTIYKNNACPNATTHTFTVSAIDENPNDATFGKLINIPAATNLTLVETPQGSGNYVGVFPPPGQYNGPGQIAMNLVCPGGASQASNFTVYIDPSGVVANQNGQPISGATVTLFSSPTGAPGTYSMVPSGSAIMSPDNRTNPQITNSSGTFGWDVIAGYYEVTSSLNGCTSASLFFPVPPSLSGVHLAMNCTPPPSAPVSVMAPTNVSATPENNSATVSWTAPQNNGGGPTTGYEVIPYIGNQPQTPQTFNSTATIETVTGLTNGTTYTFKVAAINSGVVGPISNSSNPVTPSTITNAPTNVVASPGNTTATIVWSAPTNEGGSPITAYMITPYIGDTPQMPQIFNTYATADTVTGLTNGTTYTFKVAAINAAGTGPNSQSSNQVTPENSLGPVPPSSGSNGSGPSAVVNSSGGSGSGGSGSGGVLTGGGSLISPSIGSNALATSLSFNISDTANVVGNLTSGSLYTFIWFFGWLLICVISGRYFFYRRRELDEPGLLKVVVK